MKVLDEWIIKKFKEENNLSLFTDMLDAFTCWVAEDPDEAWQEWENLEVAVQTYEQGLRALNFQYNTLLNEKVALEKELAKYQDMVKILTSENNTVRSNFSKAVTYFHKVLNGGSAKEEDVVPGTAIVVRD